MKKIIIPFEGANYSKGAFSFVSLLNKTCSLLVVGIFLPSVDYARFFFFPAAFAAPSFVPLQEAADEKLIEKNINRFLAFCSQENITGKVHRDFYEAAIPQLTKETRFADLMVLGSEVFYTVGADGPVEYLRDTLHHSDCPVVIVPEIFKPPKEIILAYDGSPSSIFAIKQFAGLFPMFSDLPVQLVYAGEEAQPLPEEILIRELAGCYFKNLSIQHLSSENKKNFIGWMNTHEDALLVCGSFSRSGISEFFTKEFVIDSIRQHKTPIFIAHT